MIPRPFGRTGFEVTPFTLGTMRFLHGWDPPADHLPEESCENAFQIIRRALAAGINLIETAAAYGKSEGLIGQALARLPQYRGQYHLMTKAAPTPTGREIRAKVEQSLRRLGVSRVELFALHGINSPEHLDMTFSRQGCMAELERMQAQGMIGAIGFSTHAPPPLVQQALDTGAFSFVNLHYHLFNPAHGKTIALAHERGMGVFIISPNDKGGLLYTPPPLLQSMCAPLHPVHVNERWLLDHPEIHTLSIGMSEPEHLDIHLESLRVDPAFITAQREAVTRIQERWDASPLKACGTDCRACLPCPVEIEIPDLLRMLHLDQAFDMTEFGRYRYVEMRPGDLWVPGADGNLCNDCGDCLPRCPQGIAIPLQCRAAHVRFNSWRKKRHTVARRVRNALPPWTWNGMRLVLAHVRHFSKGRRP